MSKASEWALTGSPDERPKKIVKVRTFWRARLKDYEFAGVSDDGGLYVCANVPNLMPAEALQFAHWIIDTFEDKPC